MDIDDGPYFNSEENIWGIRNREEKIILNQLGVNDGPQKRNINNAIRIILNQSAHLYFRVEWNLKTQDFWIRSKKGWL